MAITRLNSLAIPAGTVEPADISYPLTNFSSTGIDDNATSTAITIDASENVLVGGASQSGTANKVMVKSADKFGLSIIDTTAQATGVGGALNLGGNYRTSGDAQAFTRIAALKDNSTDNNFAYSMGFYTTSNGGTFTERMRIDSSGNLLVNSTSAGTLVASGRGLIDVDGTSDSAIGLKAAGSTYGYLYTSSSEFRVANLTANPVTFFTDNTERMRIDSSGNVILNQSAGAADNTILRITGGTAGFSTLHLADTADINIGYVQYDHTNNALTFASNNAERMRIDSSGNTIAKPSGGEITLGANGHITSKQSLDVATAGGRYIGSSNRGIVGQIKIEQTATGADGGYIDFDTCSSGSTSPTTRMTLDSSGNLGLGDSSPTAVTSSATTLEIKGGVTTKGGAIKLNSSDESINSFIYPDATNGLSINMLTAHPMRFLTSGTERMRIDSSGNVLINTTSQYGSQKLSVNGGIAIDGRSAVTPGLCEKGDTDTGIFWPTTNTLGFSTVGTERMRIDSSGRLLVGTLSNSFHTLQSNNSGNYAAGVTNSNPSAPYGLIVYLSGVTGGNGGGFLTCVDNGNRLLIRGSGSVENSTNSYGAFSDARLKSNIVDASSQIDDIMAVQVRSYTLNDTGDTHIGVVAQELEASGMSGLVTTDDEGMKSVKYSVLYMKAIKALQEAVTRIETLEAEVAALKGA